MVSGQVLPKSWWRGWLLVVVMVAAAALGSAYANANRTPRVYTPDTELTVMHDWSLFGNCALEKVRLAGEDHDRTTINRLICHRLEPLPDRPPFPAPIKSEYQETTVMFDGKEFNHCELKRAIMEVPTDELECRLNTQKHPIEIAFDLSAG